jgi:hypothetical protein
MDINISKGLIYIELRHRDRIDIKLIGDFSEPSRAIPSENPLKSLNFVPDLPPDKTLFRTSIFSYVIFIPSENPTS